MKTNPAEAPTDLARRSVLTGLLAVSTATIATTAARACSQAQSEIDHMIGLRDRWRALDRQTAAFEGRLAKLEEAYDAAIRVPPPDLAIQEADFQLLKEFGSVRRWQHQTHFFADDISEMRRRRAFRCFTRFVAPGTPVKELDTAPAVAPIGAEGVDYRVHYGRELWPLAQRRKDALVAAFDRWAVDKITLREGMGVDGAEEALEAHHEKVDDAVKAIVAAPATTPQALKFKAGMMAEWANDADPFDDWRKVDLMTALIENIAALDDAAV